MLDKNENDPVSQAYQDMIKYGFGNNLLNNVLDLQVKYSPAGAQNMEKYVLVSMNVMIYATL